MKEHKTRSLAHITQGTGSMLLFLLFAVCMLMITAVAASTYARISTSYDETFGTSVPLRYVSNKLKSAEAVEIFDDKSGAVLEIGGVISIIYFNDGTIYERTVLKSAYTESGKDDFLKDGETIAKVDGIKIEENAASYKISIQNNNEIKSVFVRRGQGD